ncbi:hypothetical protein SAE02_35980 [Skermanella aerolata]|uniref:Uncharacterized protein n=1 Tax=Skermanella aerolata TaxID=393310 RepID=A0A512DTA7_9PROT|nr:hypothetical protein SAE02_35980 [Skermanella aerolata]
MGRMFKIRISGSGAGTDAPSVEDLLDQVRDYLEILHGVEEAVAEDGALAIDWRIVDASRNSPLALECQAFPRNYAVNIDRRAELVMDCTAKGFQLLQTTAERPEYFTDKVLTKALGIFDRVTNGLNLTEVDFGEGLLPILITPVIARGAAANTDRVLKPVSKPYREFGSVEGYFQGVERDGFGRKLLYVRHRVTGDIIKCIVSGKALMEVERHQIAEVFHNRRVQVTGMLYFKILGRLSQVEANEVRFLRSRSELPQVDDIIDRDFTGGMTSEDYVERQRNSRAS